MKALGLGASDDLPAVTWSSVTLPELSCMQEHTHTLLATKCIVVYDP